MYGGKKYLPSKVRTKLTYQNSKIIDEILSHIPSNDTVTIIFWGNNDIVLLISITEKSRSH